MWVLALSNSEGNWIEISSDKIKGMAQARVQVGGVLVEALICANHYGDLQAYLPTESRVVPFGSAIGGTEYVAADPQCSGSEPGVEELIFVSRDQSIMAFRPDSSLAYSATIPAEIGGRVWLRDYYSHHFYTDRFTAVGDAAYFLAAVVQAAKDPMCHRSLYAGGSGSGHQEFDASEIEDCVKACRGVEGCDDDFTCENICDSHGGCPTARNWLCDSSACRQKEYKCSPGYEQAAATQIAVHVVRLNSSGFADLGVVEGLEYTGIEFGMRPKSYDDHFVSGLVATSAFGDPLQFCARVMNVVYSISGRGELRVIRGIES